MFIKPWVKFKKAFAKHQKDVRVNTKEFHLQELISLPPDKSPTVQGTLTTNVLYILLLVGESPKASIGFSFPQTLVVSNFNIRYLF